MRAHPSEYLIKYLMVLPAGASDDWVQRQIVALALPRPSIEYLQETRLTLQPPTPFNPSSTTDIASQAFLKGEKIHGMFFPDAPVLEANKLAADMRVRPAVEKLLLALEPLKSIAKRVNEKFGEFYTADGIGAYQHYYWNTRLLRVQDWELVFADHKYEQQEILAILRCGPEYAYHRSGFKVVYEAKTVMQKMLEGLWLDFQEWQGKPNSRDKSRCMVGLATAAAKLDSQLHEGQTNLKDTLGLFERIKVKTQKVEAPPIRQLALAGNFSRSGVDLIEVNQPVEKEPSDAAH